MQQLKSVCLTRSLPYYTPKGVRAVVRKGTRVRVSVQPQWERDSIEITTKDGSRLAILGSEYDKPKSW